MVFMSFLFSWDSSKLQAEDNRPSPHLVPGLSPGLKLLAGLSLQQLQTCFSRYVAQVKHKLSLLVNISCFLFSLQELKVTLTLNVFRKASWKNKRRLNFFTVVLKHRNILLNPLCVCFEPVGGGGAEARLVAFCGSLQISRNRARLLSAALQRLHLLPAGGLSRRAEPTLRWDGRISCSCQRHKTFHLKNKHMHLHLTVKMAATAKYPQHKTGHSSGCLTNILLRLCIYPNTPTPNTCES